MSASDTSFTPYAVHQVSHSRPKLSHRQHNMNHIIKRVRHWLPLDSLHFPAEHTAPVQSSPTNVKRVPCLPAARRSVYNGMPALQRGASGLRTCARHRYRGQRPRLLQCGDRRRRRSVYSGRCWRACVQLKWGWRTRRRVCRVARQGGQEARAEAVARVAVDGLQRARARSARTRDGGHEGGECARRAASSALAG